jgi:hypothetical protein
MSCLCVRYTLCLKCYTTVQSLWVYRGPHFDGKSNLKRSRTESESIHTYMYTGRSSILYYLQMRMDRHGVFYRLIKRTSTEKPLEARPES